MRESQGPGAVEGRASGLRRLSTVVVGDGSTSEVEAETASRTASPAFHASSRYRPLPTGAWPNGSAGRSAGGIPSRRWAGAMGWVAASRKPAIGTPRWKRTVDGPSASTVTSRHDVAPDPVYDGSFSTPTVNSTSCAVTGSPSCQVASRRSSKVYDDPASPTLQLSARSGTYVPSDPRRTSPENVRATRTRSADDIAPNGLIDVGRPTNPSR
jgi:hypothetical protein